MPIGSVQKKVGANLPTSASAPPSSPELGPQYQSLLDANPYRGQTYTRTPWQNVLSALGFRTQADAWEENMRVQAAEYDASIAQKAYDESYNTPSMQVERMRAAGLNPDLDGGSSINPGEAAPLGQDPSTPMQSTGAEGTFGEAVGTLSQIANMVLGGFSQGIGLVQTLQGVHANRLQNFLLGIQGEDAFQQFVESQWKNFLPDFPTDEVMMNGWDWKQEAQRNAAKFARGNLPKKLQNKFISSIERFWSNGPKQGQAYGEWLNEVRNMKNYSIESQTFFSQIPDVLEDITGPLAAAMQEITNKELKARQSSADAADAVAKADQAKAEDDKTYYDTFDSKMQAEAENKTNENEKTEQSMMVTLNGTLDTMVQNLKRTSSKGGFEGTIAQIALVFTAFARLWLANQGAPNFSRASQGSNKSSAPSASGGGFEIIRDPKFNW